MTYEYKCELCGSVVEKDFPMKEEHPKKVYCKNCGKKSAYRLFPGAVHIPFDFGSTDNRIHTEKKPNKRFY